MLILSNIFFYPWENELSLSICCVSTLSHGVYKGSLELKLKSSGPSWEMRYQELKSCHPRHPRQLVRRESRVKPGREGHVGQGHTSAVGTNSFAAENWGCHLLAM